jgi:hypothetical protein
MTLDDAVAMPLHFGAVAATIHTTPAAAAVFARVDKEKTAAAIIFALLYAIHPI